MTPPARSGPTGAHVVEAELTWLPGNGAGEPARFERGVRLAVDAEGRISAVERRSERQTGATARAAVRRLSGRALLPGLVNAHSHAFQRGLRGRGERFPEGAGSFWTWRRAMYDLVESIDPETVRDLSLRAFREMRRAGITTVGEFHYLHHADPEAADWRLDEAVIDAASEAGVRLALLQVYYAAGGPGRPVEGAQRRFRAPSLDAYWEQLDRLAGHLDPDLQSLGVVAHSLRAATPEEAAALYRGAVERDLPFHLHLEEQPREIEECLDAYGSRPMELLLDRVLPDGPTPRVTAVHCTHTHPEDMARFVHRGVGPETGTGGNVCICPTTEANLGDGIADLPGILDDRGAVCLGTDSNARIAMLEEVRWLELVQRLAEERRGVVRDGEGRTAAPLLEAATGAGARALGVEAGAIRQGAWADFAVVDLGAVELEGVGAEELAEGLVYGGGNRVVAGTCVGGRWSE